MLSMPTGQTCAVTIEPTAPPDAEKFRPRARTEVGNIYYSREPPRFSYYSTAIVRTSDAYTHAAGPNPMLKPRAYMKMKAMHTISAARFELSGYTSGNIPLIYFTLARLPSLQNVTGLRAIMPNPIAMHPPTSVTRRPNRSMRNMSITVIPIFNVDSIPPMSRVIRLETPSFSRSVGK